jgi:hypothetical protein
LDLWRLDRENTDALLVDDQKLSEARDEVARTEMLALRLQLQPATLFDLPQPAVGLAVSVPELAEVALVENAKPDWRPKNDATACEPLALKVYNEFVPVEMK